MTVPEILIFAAGLLVGVVSGGMAMQQYMSWRGLAARRDAKTLGQRLRALEEAREEVAGFPDVFVAFRSRLDVHNIGNVSANVHRARAQARTIHAKHCCADLVRYVPSNKLEL